MASRHLNLTILKRLARCELETVPSLDALHHLAYCAKCRSLLKGLPSATRQVLELYLGRSFSERPRTHQADLYSNAIDRAFRSIIDENSRLEVERQEARKQVHELLPLSFAQQRLILRNCERYQTWSVAERLLEASRARWADDPSGAERLALLAVEVAKKLHPSGFRENALNDLRAEAWSYIANCRRIRSDLRASTDAFAMAERYLHDGTGDPLERAHLSSLKSSLLRAARDFEGAELLLDAAIEAYRQAGDTHLEGRALVKKAKLLHDRGRAEESIPVLKRAGSLVDEQRDPSLVFALRQSLVFNLNEAGYSAEAWKLLPEVRQLAREHGSRLDRLRVLWTEGLICQNLGQVELAEEALKQVREGFIAAEIGYDVALVSLDLAALYLEAGRTGEVKQLAAEMLPIFSSLQIHREVIMAWTVFRQAVEQEVATVRVIEEVAARIREVQGRPALSGEAL